MPWGSRTDGPVAIGDCRLEIASLITDPAANGVAAGKVAVEFDGLVDVDERLVEIAVLHIRRRALEVINRRLRSRVRPGAVPPRGLLTSHRRPIFRRPGVVAGDRRQHRRDVRDRDGQTYQSNRTSSIPHGIVPFCSHEDVRLNRQLKPKGVTILSSCDRAP